MTLGTIAILSDSGTVSAATPLRRKPAWDR
jgi:hypothetical protein